MIGLRWGLSYEDRRTVAHVPRTGNGSPSVCGKVRQVEIDEGIDPEHALMRSYEMARRRVRLPYRFCNACLTQSEPVKPGDLGLGQPYEMATRCLTDFLARFAPLWRAHRADLVDLVVAFMCSRFGRTSDHPQHEAFAYAVRIFAEKELYARGGLAEPVWTKTEQHWSIRQSTQRRQPRRARTRAERATELRRAVAKQEELERDIVCAVCRRLPHECDCIPAEEQEVPEVPTARSA